jgi:hypothetical protein
MINTSWAKKKILDSKLILEIPNESIEGRAFFSGIFN